MLVLIQPEFCPVTFPLQTMYHSEFTLVKIYPTVSKTQLAELSSYTKAENSV